MDDSSGSSIILILILVIVNAFFASAEMAIVSINKTKLNLLAEDNNKKAKLLLNLLKDASGFLATIQVGITFAGFFASASAATSISKGFGTYLNNLGIPYGNDIALILTTLIISYITLVLGELVPKRIALQNAEKVAMFSVKPIIFISKFTKPFVWFLSISTTSILRLFGIKDKSGEEKISREEIRSLVELGEEQGAINQTERTMIDGIIKFDDILAREIMTPRTETFCIEANSNVKENINLILQENYSRIPVYENNIDNIIGVIHEKDFYDALDEKKENIDSIIKPILYVTSNTKISELLKKFQYIKNHMAVVIDEFGGTMGIITLEDVLEELVGEIWDEHDEVVEYFKKLDEGKYNVMCSVSLSDFFEEFNMKEEIDDFEVQTVNGWIIKEFGYLPSIGESFIYKNLKISISKIGDRKIEEVIVEKLNEQVV